MKGLISLTWTIFVLLTASSLAATIHVPADSASIQAAIDISINGDTVLVADGIYPEHIDFLGKAILVASENGAGSTIIEKAVNSLSIVSFINSEDENSILCGFTVRNSSDRAGITCIGSSPVIENCIVESNINYSTSPNLCGGGILFRDNAAPTIRNNILRNNYGVHGGALSAIDCDESHQALIYSNYIYDNSVSNNGAGFHAFNCSFIFKRNVVYDNDAGLAGGAMRIDARGGIIENNTICGNTAASVAGGIFCEGYSTDTYIRNNIFYGNSHYGFNVLSGSNLHLLYNCFYGNASGPYNNIVPEAGNILVDPLFIDPSLNDYRLTSGSPCMDTGDPSSPLDPDGTPADMGALYFNSLVGFGDIVGVATNKYGILIEGVEVSVVGEVYTDITNEYGEYILADLPTPAVYEISFSHIDYDDTSIADIWVFTDEIIELNMLIPNYETIHVPGDFPTIQAAIDISINGDTVLVADGIYPEHIDFLGKAILVASENGAGSTIIEKAVNSLSIVSFINSEDENSILCGFTVRNSSDRAGITCIGSSPVIENCIVESNINYSTSPNLCGGGILFRDNAAPTIRNNILRNNYGVHGGALSAIDCDESHQALIYSNYIYDNSVSNNGAGFHAFNCSFIFKRNVVYDNDAGLAGGAMRIDARGGIIENNTICGNTAASVAGGIFCEGYSTDTYIRNNIFYGNSHYGFNVLSGSNLHLLYNCFYGNASGPYNNIVPEAGNILVDPLFIDPSLNDYRLTSGSPCMDTGDPSSPLDPDGTPADMGALYFVGYLYLPGDINMANGLWPPQVIGADVTYLVNYFKGLPASQPCLIDGFWCSADANGDCIVMGSDVTRLVGYFKGTADIKYCVNYVPAFPPIPDDPPAGWPNCETPPATGQVIPIGVSK
ncbi:MAG: right-handed parallel beta-helix repeat-containing protein [candidate division Zixibacteria bacterium]|nr:right-handed parallel beta-helix repeat-containing protein [candidate division Zixibacteria bacterium]